MKKLNVFLFVLTIFSFSTNIQAQEESEGKKSKITVIAYGGIGYGIVDNDVEPNYNLNSNSGDLVVNYRFGESYGIATGVGINQLSGNGFNSSGNFYHERNLVKIPLLLTIDKGFANNFRVLAYLGPYGQTIYDDEYTFATGKIKDVYEGWTFGFQLGLGILYDVSNHFSVGINYNGQSDFTKLDSGNNQIIKNEQHLKSFNTVGLMFILGFK